MSSKVVDSSLLQISSDAKRILWYYFLNTLVWISWFAFSQIFPSLIHMVAQQSFCGLENVTFETKHSMLKGRKFIDVEVQKWAPSFKFYWNIHTENCTVHQGTYCFIFAKWYTCVDSTSIKRQCYWEDFICMFCSSFLFNLVMWSLIQPPSLFSAVFATTDMLIYPQKIVLAKR